MKVTAGLSSVPGMGAPAILHLMSGVGSQVRSSATKGQNDRRGVAHYLLESPREVGNA